MRVTRFTVKKKKVKLFLSSPVFCFFFFSFVWLLFFHVAVDVTKMVSFVLFFASFPNSLKLLYIIKRIMFSIFTDHFSFLIIFILKFSILNIINYSKKILSYFVFFFSFLLLLFYFGFCLSMLP